MADFRKWVLVVAVLALAVSASAQQMVCTSLSGGVNTLVRQEGLAELVGDIVLRCEGTTTGAVSLNLQVFLNTNVTSKNLGDGSQNSLTESLLLLGNLDANGGEPGSGLGTPVTVGANVFQGRLGATSASLVWTGIPITTAAAPVATTRIIRLTNIRANANAIPAGANLPGTIQALISIQATQTITLVNPQFTVAAVFTGMRDVSLRKADNGDSLGTPNFGTCTGKNTDIAGSATTSTRPDLSFQIRYRENFNTAFKTMGGPGSGVPQTVPGQPFLTESGLTPSGMSSTIGQATQGTRLFARFNNVPANVQIWVTMVNVNAPADAAGVILSGSPLATLVGFDPAAGGPGTSPPSPVGSNINSPTVGIPAGISINQNRTTSTATGLATGIVQVPLVGGTGSAVWEVLSADTGGLDQFRFGVVVAYSSNLTITTSPTPAATVNGGFAPISTVTTSSSSAPVPRFADTSSSMNAFTISLCVTNILFPFVTNQAGFDTGIALVNTSLDNATGSSATGTGPLGKNQPFNTTPQHGTCTLYYFGNMSGGGTPPAPQTTVDIAAGNMVAFAVSTGGVPGSTSSAAGFQGYVIARCNFQFAHGFAFISAVGGGGNLASHGYLALIIPDRTRQASAFDQDSTGQGEQLVN